MDAFGGVVNVVTIEGVDVTTQNCDVNHDCNYVLRTDVNNIVQAHHVRRTTFRVVLCVVIIEM